MTLSTLLSIDLGVWFGHSVTALLILIAADVISGVAASLRNGYTDDGVFHPDFEFRELARFYLTSIVPYLIGYIALSMVVKAVVPSELFGLPLSATVQTAAWGTIVLAIGKSVVENLKAVFSPDIFPILDDDEDGED